MPPKKKEKKKAISRAKKAAPKKQPTSKKRIKTSGEKPINPLVLAPGVRTTQTTI